jgi:Tfp pilus assembly protein PilN
MRAVNLLPDRHHLPAGQAESSRSPLVRALVLAVPAVLVLAVLTVSFMSAKGTVEDRSATLAELQEEVAERLRPPEPVQQAAGEDPDVAARLAAAETAIGARVSWDEVLRQFALILPLDVSITSLQASSSGAAQPGADPAAATGVPTAFTIAGYTASQPSVSRLMTRLTQVPAFTDVQLQSTQRSDVEGRPVIQFTIAAGIRPDGGVE